MLSLKNITISRAGTNLIENSDLIIYPKECIGLVGNNGTGKSSLFAAISGRLDIDSGELEKSDNLHIVEVKQETPALEKTAVDFVLDGNTELRKLEAELKQAEEENNHPKIALIHDELTAISAYSQKAKAQELLSGLGFSVNEHNKTVKEFSGGFRMRLNLAQALMANSDLLLLDEPTNHLDLDTLFWLQDFLHKHSAAKIIIAHDREFLDNLCSKIISIENKKLYSWTGNYSQYEKLKIELLEQEKASFQKQEAKRAHLEKFVAKFRYKASKAKQAQSRLKALEKLTKQVLVLGQDSSFPLSLPIPEKTPQLLIKLDNLTAAYAEKKILNSVNLKIEREERIGLLGKNGAGKSSLIKILAGLDNPKIIAGKRNINPDTKIAYFAQHQIDNLNLSENALFHIQKIRPDFSTQECKNFLGGFGFGNRRDEVLISNFSGGEKARLALALIIAQKPNLLLLDEPTNHLDLQTREQLTQSLQDYSGTLVIISHDRNLLRNSCDKFLLIDHCEIKEYDGDLDDYRQYLQACNKENSNNLTAINQDNNKQAKRRENAEKREILRPFKKNLEIAEKELDKANKELEKIQAKLSDETIYQEERKTELKTLLEEENKAKNALNDAEAKWLQTAEELEQKEAELSRQ